MAKEAQKVSARMACVAAIRAAGKPLTANQIATAVIASGAVPTLKGKTPKGTIAKVVSAGANSGSTFRQVGTASPKKFDLRPNAMAVDDALVERLREKVAEVVASPTSRAKAAPRAKATSVKPSTAKMSTDVQPDAKPSQRAKRRSAATA